MGKTRKPWNGWDYADKGWTPETVRTCTGPCGKTLQATASNFLPNLGGAFGLSSWCRECNRAYCNKYRHENRDAIRAAERSRYKRAQESKENTREDDCTMIAANPAKFSAWLSAVAKSREPYVITGASLARSLGCAPATVYGWFKGRSTPPKTMMPRLAEVLCVPEGDLLDALSPLPGATAILAPAMKDLANTLRRERYQNDPDYRKAVNDAQRTPAHLLSPKRLHQLWVMSLPRAEQVAHVRARRSRNKARRRCRILGLGEDFTPKEFRTKTKALGSKCSYCGVCEAELCARNQGLTADHVYALALLDTPGKEHLASNTIDNIFPACFPCNSSKGDRDLMEWLRAKGYGATVNPAAVAHYDSWPAQREHLRPKFSQTAHA